MKTAWMFPGQGTQFPGMARGLMREFPVARDVMAEAEQISSLSLEAVRARGPLDAMTRVACLEPMLAAVSIGYAKVLMESGLTPDYVAGYSAGEVPALFIAGALSQSDALKTATIRGRVLSKYTDPDVRMVAVSRLDRFTTSSIAQAIDHSASDGSVAVAGENAPDHSTIVGKDDLVRLVEARIIARGGDCSPVSVSGMWHTRGLADAAIELHEELQRVPFSTPRLPVFSSATGTALSSPDELRRALAQQIAMPVRWQSIIQQLRENHVTKFLEVGTGRTLLGMLRRNWLNPSEYSVTSVEGNSGNIKPLKRLIASSTQQSKS